MTSLDKNSSRQSGSLSQPKQATKLKVKLDYSTKITKLKQKPSSEPKRRMLSGYNFLILGLILVVSLLAADSVVWHHIQPSRETPRCYDDRECRAWCEGPQRGTRWNFRCYGYCAGTNCGCVIHLVPSDSERQATLMTWRRRFYYDVTASTMTSPMPHSFLRVSENSSLVFSIHLFYQFAVSKLNEL